MNKVNKFLLVIIYCLFSFSISALIIDQTFTVGGISLQGGEKGAGKIFGDFLGYRFIERSTGLGVSLYALNVDMSDTININFFPIELNWEPFYPWSEFMGLGTFLRIDSICKI
ncbi:MAG: hypothetical protein B6229_10895 [Spirochaetaceae bacterium 4572_7]|nr:MAG: hypothetical protein B6229_10895 [Spirochaetaceae bacterium 4572_7]